jgi:feruloyl esterase
MKNRGDLSMKKRKTICLVLSATAVLTACGGGDDSSSMGGGDNPPSLASTDPQAACQALASTAKVAGTTIDAATYAAAGAVLPGSETPIERAVCRVQMTSKPSADSDIKSELWIPTTAAWNGRFLAVGGGGNSGSIQYSAIRDGVARGFATLSTDNGHQGNEQSFATGHPEKVIDFGHRAQGVTSAAGKTLTQAFFNEPAKKSYWLGCSQGGGKGMMQSQRYPENFDGIVAGSPVFDWVGSQYAAPWVAVKGMRDPAQFVPRAKLPAIHTAVLASCDASDGLVDGLIQQPQRCNVDPAAMMCPGGTDSNSCLTPGQVTAMKRYFAPVTRPDGRKIYAGYVPGSEGNSPWLGATAPSGNWAGFWPNVVFEDASYSIVASLDVDTDKDFNIAKAKLGEHYDAVSTDLSKYRDKGGKLLIWHGYNDSLVSAYHTQDYVDALNTRYGAENTSTFVRSFFAPGVNHCGGGEGPAPDQLDMLDKMVDWVEKGIAPTTILATHRTGGTVDRTMPLCAYPQVARYNGTGDKNSAASFTCSQP